jgi:hypothetical protein
MGTPEPITTRGGSHVRALLAEIGRQYADGIRSTLPQSEQDVGTWMAGMVWGLVLFVVILAVVSYLTLAAQGRAI